MSIHGAWGFLLALACMVGCSEKPAPAARSGAGGTGSAPRNGEVLRVVATVPPVRGIVEPILKGASLKYDLQTLTPPGVSEHGYEIPPDKLGALDKADVVVMVGLGMEPQVEKFLAQHERKGRRVVVLTDTVKAPLEHKDDRDEGHAEGHANGPGDGHGAGHADDDHHHSGDPHVWLDPVMVEEMVGTCTKALKEAAGADLAGEKRLDESQAAMLERVRAVDGRYKAALARTQRRTIIVAHDAYDYLARRYDLEVVAITGLNAGEPQPADIKKAADAVREKGLTTIFVEPQLSPAAAQRIAQATGARIAVLDPLGDGDWFALMDRNLKALIDALGEKTEAADGGAGGGRGSGGGAAGEPKH